jgi:hypothetical protein
MQWDGDNLGQDASKCSANGTFRDAWAIFTFTLGKLSCHGSQKGIAEDEFRDIMSTAVYTPPTVFPHSFSAASDQAMLYPVDENNPRIDILYQYWHLPG